MNITSKILGGLALSFISLAACGGGGSGVDGDKAIVAMSSSERTDFCEWAIEEQGGAGTVTTCADDVTVTVQSVSDCVASFDDFIASCTATVAQGETCVEAIADNPCEFGGDSCDPVFECQ